MADDPRIEPTEEYIRLQFGASADEANLAALGIIGEADHHDPLRALLAAEDRAVEKLGQSVYGVAVDHPMWIGDEGQPLEYLPAREALIGQFIDDAARAVLAALREVAGNG